MSGVQGLGGWGWAETRFAFSFIPLVFLAEAMVFPLQPCEDWMSGVRWAARQGLGLSREIRGRVRPGAVPTRDG